MRGGRGGREGGEGERERRERGASEFNRSSLAHNYKWYMYCQSGGRQGERREGD